MLFRTLTLLTITLCFCHLSQATEAVQVDYMLNCQGCHLPDGSGFPRRNVPAIKNHMGKFLSVEGGRDYLIQVPGSAQSDLPDKELTQLINWMLLTFSPTEIPKDFIPYSVNEVSELRKFPLINVAEVRQTLLERISNYEKQPTAN